jgi:hypothetical protein
MFSIASTGCFRSLETQREKDCSNIIYGWDPYPYTGSTSCFFILRLIPVHLLREPHPQLQRVLAHPPSARVTALNTGEVVELFDGGWLHLDEGLPQVRVIVARHAAPPPDRKVKVGKRMGEWVYELFITTLPVDGFLVEDALDLYHGRGAFEAVLADEDVEVDPDRWCS